MKKNEKIFVQTTFVLSLCFWFSVINAGAAVWAVTKTADTNDGVCDADCSLREAIAAAAASGDTITFNSLFNTPQTITLGAGQIVIGKTVTIQGPGANLLTVSGGGASRVFLSGFSSGRTVVISGMKITGGAVTNENGGAIKNNTGITLHLTNVIVTGNSVTGSGFTIARGGGISNEAGGQLNIDNAVVSNNSVAGGSAPDGGGIFNAAGSFNGNPSTVTITNSVISGNTSTNFGGGIANSAEMSITASTVSGNQATGASGGGIYVTSSNATTITASTVSGNSANNSGGGINITNGVVNITNSTVSSNGAVFGGGGIDKAAAQATTLNNVTVTNNTATNTSSTGGGVRTANGAFNTRNSIFAGNTSNTNPDVNGTVVSQGYNLVGNSAGANGFAGPGDILNPAGGAKLSPLGNYGGATMTHAPLLNAIPALNSPAIDAADPLNPTATDQRGVARPQDGDNNASPVADIGAFELPAAASNYTAALPSAAPNQPYSVTIAADNTQQGVTFTYCISGGALPSGLTGINPCSAASDIEEAPAPDAAVVISGSPTQAGTFNFTVRAADPGANFTETAYALNVLAPTAARVSVGGRVLTADGRGISNARLSITDSNGETRTTFSGSFGFYRFTDVPTGETYVLNVFAKRYLFNRPTQVHTITGETGDLDFIADNF